jgi:hypothetical protein
MAFTVFDAQVNAHDYVGTISYGETTNTGCPTSAAGTTNHNTIMDQAVSTAHADDQFNGGTIYFVRSGDQTGSTATYIEKRSRRITDYDASSGQYTFSPLTTASTATLSSGGISTGTLYGVATPEFSLPLMNRLTNAVLRTLGPLVYSARAIASSASQQVYTVSTAIAIGGAGTFGKYSRPFRIDIQGRLGSSADDPSWVELHGWYTEPTTAGSGLNVIFPRDLPSGRDVRIWYEDHHTELYNSTSLIDERLHPELVTLALVDKMYQYRNSRSRGAQEFDIQRWNDAKRQLAEARIRWPIWRPKRRPKTLRIGGGLSSGGNFANPNRALE